mmetsp:Transcript_120320/g.187914  ORF Transcript_120320/g.187914 Transcript_120320/m.187914 type:complete len:121 (+) Transcript_120320:2-364(+)
MACPFFAIAKDDGRLVNGCATILVPAETPGRSMLYSALEAIYDMCRMAHAAALEYGISHIVQSSGMLRREFLLDVMPELQDLQGSAELSDALSRSVRFDRRKQGFSVNDFADIILKAVSA